jgi:hypothetical protein
MNMIGFLSLEGVNISDIRVRSMRSDTTMIFFLFFCFLDDVDGEVSGSQTSKDLGNFISRLLQGLNLCSLSKVK